MIKEIIVVEGRDDTLAIKRAVEADTIETHGFGISEETWKLLEKAYHERGLIIMTDPDHAGEEIRKRIKSRFPKAKHIYLSREKAKAKGDIGVENASPNAIKEALQNIKEIQENRESKLKRKDLLELGLEGTLGSRDRRNSVGEVLGIGAGNGKGFLKKLNVFGVSKEELQQAVKEYDKKEQR